MRTIEQMRDSAEQFCNLTQQAKNIEDIRASLLLSTLYAGLADVCERLDQILIELQYMNTPKQKIVKRGTTVPF